MEQIDIWVGLAFGIIIVGAMVWLLIDRKKKK